MLRYIVIILLLLHSADVLAWGAKGHRIIALLAETRLSSATQAALDDILQGEDLASAAVWADTMRSSRANPEFWTDHAAVWHYVNIPPGQRYSSATADSRGDAILAMQTLTAILQDRPVPAGAVRNSLEDYFGGRLDAPQRLPDVKRFALKFLIHIVGDLQQPLHSGYAEDRGGNEVALRWFGKRSNLHALWDSQLLDQQESGAPAYARQLSSRIDRMAANDIRSIERAAPLAWTTESRLVLDRIYAMHDGRNVFGADYAARFLPIAELQLIRGGLRMAWLLNNIFDG